jgi:hypothetical protein
MTRIQNTCFWFLMFCWYGVLLLVGNWYFFPEDPLYVNESEIEVLTNPVKAGTPLTYRVQIFLRGDYPAVLGGSFIGENGKKYTSNFPETGALPPGCHDLTIDVPTREDMLPGWYRYRRTALITVNPFHIEREVYMTPRFEVVK